MSYRTLFAAALALAALPVQAQVFHGSSGSIQGSLCVGFDCTGGEAFGFDTLRLKENNLRIDFTDTSNTASFPTQDWQLVANESTNGGLNAFWIQSDAPTGSGNRVFLVEAGARNNALYVENSGEVGIGTNNPVADVHIKIGDTPTVRLEQDNTSGFTPQTWDMAGNETNWFIRDATTGSRLPLRIRPGASTSSIDIDGDGNVRIGHANTAEAKLHVRRTDGSAKIQVEDLGGSGPQQMVVLKNNGAVQWLMENTTNGAQWMLSSGNSLLFVPDDNAANSVAELSNTGDLTIDGTLTVTGGTTVPDYVFAEDYALMPLAELEDFVIRNRHLPNIPPARDIARTGLNMTEMQMALLEKVEELTLYTLAQQEKIERLQARLDALTE